MILTLVVTKKKPMFKTTLSNLIGPTGDLVDNITNAMNPLLDKTQGYPKNVPLLGMGCGDFLDKNCNKFACGGKGSAGGVCCQQKLDYTMFGNKCYCSYYKQY